MEHQKQSPNNGVIAFNPLSSSLVCVLGARAKNLLSYYVSQVNKVIWVLCHASNGRESMGIVCGGKEAIVSGSLAILKNSVCLWQS